MFIFLIAIFVILVFYLVLICLLYRGLSKLRPGQNPSKPMVSVIVAARNEADRLLLCLDALSTQSYPSSLYEVIVIDDRSDDSTASVIKSFTGKHSNFRSVTISEQAAGMAPKKWALTQGIARARGSIFMLTDADCIPSPVWIETMIRYFEDDVGFVAGYSPLVPPRSRSLFFRMAALDALALGGVAAGSIALGFPLTCSGRNLAYRKESFEEVNGFQDIGRFVSGDDDLLMHLIRRRTGWLFRYAVERESQVRSEPPLTLRAFFRQRTRHASKGLYYSLPMKTILILIYCLNLFLLTALFFERLWPFFLPVWLIKSAAEYLFLQKTAALFKQKDLLSVFPFAAMVHFIYVVVFGLWGQVARVRWKNGTSPGRIPLSGARMDREGSS